MCNWIATWDTAATDTIWLPHPPYSDGTIINDIKFTLPETPPKKEEKKPKSKWLEKKVKRYNK